MNAKSNSVLRTKGYLYIILVLSALLPLIISLVACFLPAVVSTYIFKAVHKKFPLLDNNHEHSTTLLAAIGQISLYISGGLTFHNLVFVKGYFQINGLVSRMGQHNSWQPLYLCFLFVFLPCLFFCILNFQKAFKEWRSVCHKWNSDDIKTASYRDINWDSKDPFAILGVSQSSAVSEIKHSYHRLMFQYHPDRVATLAPNFRKIAEDRTKTINWAYEQLSRRKAA